MVKGLKINFYFIKLLLLANKNSKVSGLVSNDEILFLITTPYAAHENGCGAGLVPFGFGTTGTMIIPRSDILNFRKVFVNTFDKFKYKIGTMRQFKYLSRKYIFGFDGLPLKNGWDLTMDHFTFKNINLSDLDRKILLPDSWLKESIHCYFYAQRLESYNLKITGSVPHKTTDSIGYPFVDFPEFIIYE